MTRPALDHYRNTNQGESTMTTSNTMTDGPLAGLPLPSADITAEGRAIFEAISRVGVEVGWLCRRLTAFEFDEKVQAPADLHGHDEQDALSLWSDATWVHGTYDLLSDIAATICNTIGGFKEHADPAGFEAFVAQQIEYRRQVLAADRFDEQVGR